MYLNTNKTFLGTDADKEHQTKVILLTAAMLRQNQVTDFAELIQLYKTYGFIDPATLAARYPILYEGSTAIESAASIEAHVLLYPQAPSQDRISIPLLPLITN